MVKKGTMLWGLLGVLWSLAYGLTPVFGAAVPDTVQTKCYDDAWNLITCPSEGQRLYGQDGNYTIHLPSYTKLDSSGNALPDSRLGSRFVTSQKATFRIAGTPLKRAENCSLMI